MIDRFIETVLPNAEGRTSVWYRAEPGHKVPIDKQKWFSWPEDRQKMIDFIAARSAKDIYLPVSLYSTDKRTPENTTLVGALWQDTDTFDPEGYRVKPSIVVKTSEGRTHCWFVLDKPYPADQAELVVKKMTYAHRGEGADVSSWGRNKLLRVPGTYNSSHGFPELVTAEYTGEVYSLEEVANAYDDVPLPSAIAKSTPGTEVVPVQPKDVPDTLPDFFDAQAKLPEDFPLELLTAEPRAGNRSELRWRLLAELVEAGLTDEEVFVIAQSAPAASKWLEDRRGMDGLWGEILKERQRFEWGEVEGATPAEPKIPAKRPKVELLTTEQRKRAKQVFETTWIHEYEQWIAKNLKTFNPPYHRAGAWMALSQLVGECARLNIRGRDTPLGLYFFVLGNTSSGKSEAKDYMQTTIHKGYDGEANPDIGDDISAAALLDILRDRPRGVSMMSSDEVDGLLAQMRDKGGWRSSDMATYTYLYDGKVQPVARKGSTDRAGKWTKTQFSWFGMGTPHKVINVLDRTMFESGFLVRFQWFLGDDVKIAEDELGVTLGGAGNYKDQVRQVEDWGRKFARVREGWSFRRMQAGDDDLPIIEPDSEATAEFLRKITAGLEFRLWSGDPNADILKPSLRRTNITATKFAALLALADGRFTFNEDDILVGLWQCEELLANVYYMAGQVASSEHSKALDSLYDYILAHGPDVKSERIFRAMSDHHGLDVIGVERYRDELRAQGRVTFVNTGQKHSWAATALEEQS